MTEYKCPYCGQTEYNTYSKKSGPFPDWKAVRYHTPKCNKNTGVYTITEEYGPIHYIEFTTDLKYTKTTYPKLDKLCNITAIFRKKGYYIPNYKISFTDTNITESIQTFYIKNNRIPQQRDFQNNILYPSYKTMQNRFGSWNNAIVAAGFTPDTNDGFGTRTKGLDGHLYRSRAEAYFCDNFLFEKYKYDIEPKYPDSSKHYDWYIPDLDLYIELDGEIRPETIRDKILINDRLNRNCLFIKTKDIYNKQSLEDLIMLGKV